MTSSTPRPSATSGPPWPTCWPPRRPRPTCSRGPNSPETYDAKLWRTVAAEIGIAGLLIPEPLGGAGASYRELAAAAEQFGAAVAPIPYLGSAVVATAVLLSAARSAAAADANAASQGPAAPWTSGEGLSGPAAAARAAALRAQAQASSGGATRTAPVSPAAGLLRQLADGSLTAALAVTATAAPRGPFPAAVRVSGAGPAGSGRDRAGEGVVKLRGQVKAVADALPAGMLLVPAEGVPNGLFLVDATAPGVHRTPVVSLDMTRQLCDISFDDAEARLIVVGEAARTAVDVDVAVNDALRMRSLEPVRDFNRQSEKQSEFERMESDAMLERRPFKKFHRDEGLGVVLANLVNRADVGMIQGRRSAGFAAEPLEGLCVLGKFFRKEFQRDEASELEVFGFVDHAHPAAAQFLDNAVMRNGFADHFSRAPVQAPVRDMVGGMWSSSQRKLDWRILADDRGTGGKPVFRTGIPPWVFLASDFDLINHLLHVWNSVSKFFCLAALARVLDSSGKGKRTIFSFEADALLVQAT